jgi:hypothetical protein
MVQIIGWYGSVLKMPTVTLNIFAGIEIFFSFNYSVLVLRNLINITPRNVSVKILRFREVISMKRLVIL